MKILQLLCVPLYGTGSGTYVRKLSERLVKSGHQVAIVTPDNRELKKIKIYEVKLPFMATFLGQPEHPEAKLYSKLSGEELNDVQTAFESSIIKAVEDFRPDVIHVHHAANLSWIANYLKSVYQIHYIITSHNTDVINAILDKRYIPMTQDALNRADVITAVSKNTKDRLLKIFGKGLPKMKSKTKVISCGVDTKFYPSRGSVDLANEKFNLKGKKVILYSGRVNIVKGVGILIKTAKLFPEIAFVIMGNGEDLDQLKQLVKEIGVKNIIFTGYLGPDDQNLMCQLYRRADIVAVPSIIVEGVPLSALEAMSSGALVIASNIGGIPTAISNLKNGILVKPKSVSALAEAIKFAYNNPRKVKKMVLKARNDVKTKFDWKVISKKFEHAYNVAFQRGLKNRLTKKPSFVSEEEYMESKEYAKQKIKL